MEIFRNKRLWVEEKQVELPNGVISSRVTVHPGDAVAILPIHDDKIILIRQYRDAIGEYIYEAPAGIVDPGETPPEAAKRELIEETEMDTMLLMSRGFIYTTPGISDEKIWLFEARRLVPSSKFKKEDGEIIETEIVKMNELRHMITRGVICDAKTICLIYRCLGGFE